MSKRKVYLDYDKAEKEAKEKYAYVVLEKSVMRMGFENKDFCDKLFPELKGATIIDVGFLPWMEGGLHEGRLTFDYMKDGVEKRIILGYTELGEWVEWCGEKL